MSFFLRRAMRLPQIRSQAASITQRRGLADAAGKDGAAKVNFWQQPLNPRNWNGEVVSLVFVFALVLYSTSYLPYQINKEVLEKLHNENREDLSDEGSSVLGANQGSYHIRASRRA